MYLIAHSMPGFPWLVSGIQFCDAGIVLMKLDFKLLALCIQAFEFAHLAPGILIMAPSIQSYVASIKLLAFEINFYT